MNLWMLGLLLIYSCPLLPPFLTLNTLTTPPSLTSSCLKPNPLPRPSSKGASSSSHPVHTSQLWPVSFWAQIDLNCLVHPMPRNMTPLHLRKGAQDPASGLYFILLDSRQFIIYSASWNFKILHFRCKKRKAGSLGIFQTTHENLPGILKVALHARPPSCPHLWL